MEGRDELATLPQQQRKDRHAHADTDHVADDQATNGVGRRRRFVGPVDYRMTLTLEANLPRLILRPRWPTFNVDRYDWPWPGRARGLIRVHRPPRSYVAIIGLGHVFDLNIRAYVDNPDAEVVAIVDPVRPVATSDSVDWPAAAVFANVDSMLASDVDIDAVEVLLPTTENEDVVLACVANGWHVNLQKPLANDLASAERMARAATEHGVQLRVMENYLFYEPLLKLKATIESGELGRSAATT